MRDHKEYDSRIANKLGRITPATQPEVKQLLKPPTPADIQPVPTAVAIAMEQQAAALLIKNSDAASAPLRYCFATASQGTRYEKHFRSVAAFLNPAPDGKIPKVRCQLTWLP